MWCITESVASSTGLQSNYSKAACSQAATCAIGNDSQTCCWPCIRLCPDRPNLPSRQVPDRWPRPLDDLKDHLQFVHSFIDDHINVNKFWDDNRMYEAITDDNGDEHELDTPVSCSI